ncbi:hypothetical protein [Amycolatopsis circi]|uniref:hypothetical protein n=1 Tax=Amycolatopsis circi TaxID=871959 RepID=UPI001ABFB326|nr:hypothetical protein [Amycolatopsis circi]
MFVDAASAALIGAGIGLSGTLVVPIVTSWQGRRAKLHELKRDAYASAIAAMVGILYAENENRREAYREILTALGRIEMFGGRRAANAFNDVAEGLEDWVDGGTIGDFRAPMNKFQNIARVEIGSEHPINRIGRLILWLWKLIDPRPSKRGERP